ISAAVAFRIESIGGAWKLLIITGAGTGAVLLLRWYWWRINAWSEVSAMIAAFVVSVLLQTVGGLDSDLPLDFAHIVLITVAVTTVVWLAVTFLTRPESEATLVAFYRRTRPSRMGWGPVAARAPTTRSATCDRTCRIIVLARVGLTRFVSRMMNRSRSGSSHSDVPVKPVWPNARRDSRVPALE